MGASPPPPWHSHGGWGEGSARGDIISPKSPPPPHVLFWGHLPLRILVPPTLFRYPLGARWQGPGRILRSAALAQPFLPPDGVWKRAPSSRPGAPRPAPTYWRPGPRADGGGR